MRNRQPKRDIQEKVVFDAIVYKHGITAQSKALLDSLRQHHPEHDHRSLAEKIGAIDTTTDAITLPAFKEEAADFKGWQQELTSQGVVYARQKTTIEDEDRKVGKRLAR